MNVILFGPPGAGKGTQSQHLVNKFNYFQVSTGDLLRVEIQNKTILGNQISETIGRGELVSDSIVDDLLKKILQNNKYKNQIIFDGYPRTLSQAKELDRMLSENDQKIGSIIFLNVKREEIINRIEGRLSCVKCNKIFNQEINKKEINNHECGKENIIKRSDDNGKTIIKRFDTYMDQTKPVLQYYSSRQEFVEIDGSSKIPEISSKIEEIVRV